MDEITLLRPTGMLHSPAFSQVAVVPPGATLVLVGGQNAVDETGALVGGDVAAQTVRAMSNVVRALEAGGVAVEHLISVTVMLVAGVDVAAAYAAAVPALATEGPPPLVSAAMVAGLGVPGALVEVSAVAAVVR